MNNYMYRMAQMQIMNLVNIGVSKGISPTDIELLATATIDATQLFLKEDEIYNLRLQLKTRLNNERVLI